jgi:hypothetical protein
MKQKEYLAALISTVSAAVGASWIVWALIWALILWAAWAAGDAWIILAVVTSAAIWVGVRRP